MRWLPDRWLMRLASLRATTSGETSWSPNSLRHSINRRLRFNYPRPFRCSARAKSQRHFVFGGDVSGFLARWLKSVSTSRGSPRCAAQSAVGSNCRAPGSAPVHDQRWRVPPVTLIIGVDHRSMTPGLSSSRVRFEHVTRHPRARIRGSSSNACNAPTHLHATRRSGVGARKRFHPRQVRIATRSCVLATTRVPLS